MADKRHKITISFPKDREHVWMLFEEHCEETNESNRSAAIISLIEKALTPPTPDDDNHTGLCELERISHQIEEIRQQIEELGQLVVARNEGPGVEDNPRQRPAKTTGPRRETDQPDTHEDCADGETTQEEAEGNGGVMADDSRADVAQGDDTPVEQEPPQDNTVAELARNTRRGQLRWDTKRGRWVPCKLRSRRRL